MLLPELATGQPPLPLEEDVASAPADSIVESAPEAVAADATVSSPDAGTPEHQTDPAPDTAAMLAPDEDADSLGQPADNDPGPAPHA